jgi:hypothetical protein
MVNRKCVKLDVAVVDNLCAECFGRYLKINFRKNSGLDSIQGCIDCTKDLSGILETKVRKSFGRRGRGGRRGHGRGRGRRGGRQGGGRQGGGEGAGRPLQSTTLSDYF